MALIPTRLGPMFVEQSGPEDGRVALLWPSMFNDHRMWDPQVELLNSIGWRTLSVDPPAHGRSLGPGTTFSMDDCARCVIQLLDALKIDRPIVMIGSSWGGMVAPRVALQAPRRIEKLILFNTTAEKPSAGTAANAMLLTWMLRVRLLDGLTGNILVDTNFSAEGRKKNPQIGAAIKRNLKQWNRKSLIDAVRSVLIERDANLDALAGINVPVLAVSGSEDNVLPTPMSRRIVDKIAQGRHVEVAGGAHLVPVEKPEVANELIIEFLH